MKNENARCICFRRGQHQQVLFGKGVQFLGVIIKLHRIYIANRTKGNFYKAIHKEIKNCPPTQPYQRRTSRIPEHHEFLFGDFKTLQNLQTAQTDDSKAPFGLVGEYFLCKEILQVCCKAEAGSKTTLKAITRKVPGRSSKFKNGALC